MRVLRDVVFSVLDTDSVEQGESVPRALEHLYKSSHLNIHHNLASVTGAQMLMMSSVLSRLGALTRSTVHLYTVY